MKMLTWKFLIHISLEKTDSSFGSSGYFYSQVNKESDNDAADPHKYDFKMLFIIFYLQKHH